MVPPDRGQVLRDRRGDEHAHADCLHAGASGARPGDAGRPSRASCASPPGTWSISTTRKARAAWVGIGAIMTRSRGGSSNSTPISSPFRRSRTRRRPGASFRRRFGIRRDVHPAVRLSRAQLLGPPGRGARPSRNGVRHSARHRLSAQRRPEGARHGGSVPALGHGHHGDGRRTGAAPAVGASQDGMLGQPGQDRDGRRERTCRTLRDSGEASQGMGGCAPERERTAFVILGDFNRRLALPGDWAWGMLSPPAAPLRLLTEGIGFRCDPRYPAFIDHLVAGGGAGAVIVPGSFREVPRRGAHPDHCAVYADFRLGAVPRLIDGSAVASQTEGGSSKGWPTSTTGAVSRRSC